LTSDQDPFRSPLPADDYAANSHQLVARSGVVTAVGIITVIFGVVHIFSGFCCGGFGIYLSEALSIAGIDPQADPREREIFSWVLIGIGIALALFGLPAILAGYGIFKRRAWARWLTIGLAGCSVIATLSAFLTFVPAAPFYLGYSVFVFVVLFDSQRGREFQ